MSGGAHCAGPCDKPPGWTQQTRWTRALCRAMGLAVLIRVGGEGARSRRMVLIGLDAIDLEIFDFLGQDEGHAQMTRISIGIYAYCSNHFLLD